MICQFCGHENEPDGKFCARCGVQLQQPQQQQQSQQPQQPQQRQPLQPHDQQYPPQQQYPPETGEPRYEREQQPSQPQYPQFTQQQPPQQQQPQARYPQQPAYPPYPQESQEDQNAGEQQEAQPQRQPYQRRRQDAQNQKAGIAGLLNSLPIKKILMIGVPAIVIIIAAIIVLPMLVSPGSSTVKDCIFFLDNKTDVIVSGNNNAKFIIDGKYETYHTSLDGSKAVLLTDYDNAAGGTLWFVTTSEAVQISEGVNAFRLSDSGNGIAYFTDYDIRNNMATLHLYDVSSKKATLVTENAMYSGGTVMYGVSISPNGKSVGYTSDNSNTSEVYSGYVAIDGKAPEELGEKTFAVAISDGGKYVYYCKIDKDNTNASLNVKSSRTDVRLASSLNSLFMILNRDYSEVIYNVYDVDDRTFISKNGSEREKIGSSVIQRLITPRGTQIRNIYDNNLVITVYGMRSLSDFVAVTGDGLSYYDKKLEVNKISNSSLYANSAFISNDGRTLYFINNSNRLSSINPTDANADRKDIDKDVSAFVATEDGKSVYYVNSDNELYYAGNSGNSVKIADDVSLYLALSYSGNRVFFLMDYLSSRGGELYFSVNGGKRTRISGADEVTSIWSTPTNIFYTTRDREIYRSNGNEKFSRFHDEIY